MINIEYIVTKDRETRQGCTCHSFDNGYDFLQFIMQNKGTWGTVEIDGDNTVEFSNMNDGTFRIRLNGKYTEYPAADFFDAASEAIEEVTHS